MNARTTTTAVIAVAVLLVGGVLVYLNRPAAEEASISNALTALDAGAAGPSDAATDTTTGDPTQPTADAAAIDAPTSPDAAPATPGDVTGTWTVDTSIGTFDFGDATSTFAGFRVDEELTNVGQTEAIGRTPAVAGALEIAGTVLQEAAIEADFTQLVSDIPRRDGAMKRAMGVEEFPLGTFTLTEPIDFGEVPADGATTTFTAVGDLAVNGITHPAEFEMEASLADGHILVVGRAPVVFARYFITAPQAGPVVSIDDEGTIELQIWFTRT